MVAVSVAGMLPPVITLKMEPKTKFASIKFSYCFYEVALNEELALSSIDDFKLAMDFATNEQKGGNWFANLQPVYALQQLMDQAVGLYFVSPGGKNG